MASHCVKLLTPALAARAVDQPIDGAEFGQGLVHGSLHDICLEHIAFDGEDAPSAWPGLKTIDDRLHRGGITVDDNHPGPAARERNRPIAAQHARAARDQDRLASEVIESGYFGCVHEIPL